MCEHAPNREAAMVVLRRDETDRPTVWCDPCIAPLVDALNTGTLSTVASCCGHGGYPTRISLRDGREVFVVEAAQVDAIYAALDPAAAAGEGGSDG